MESSNRNSVLALTALLCSSLISQDLLVEIFKRLPTKILARLLCVCKAWKSLISSPLFISLHYSFACSTTPPNLKPYLRQPRGNSYLLCRPQQLANRRRLKRRVLHFPFRTKHDDAGEFFTFVDSIRGVVCVSYSFYSSFDYTILWNPGIHRYVTLSLVPSPVDLSTLNNEFAPKLVNRADFVDMEGLLDDDSYINAVEGVGNWDRFVWNAEFACSLIGFGYDASNGDFKVVRVWIPHGSIDTHSRSLVPAYEVYSSRVGIWKASTSDVLKPCGLFDHILTSKTGCFVNGAIYWIIHTRNNENRVERKVLMFDCEGEVFRIVELPREIFHTAAHALYSQRTKLMEYGGMLSVVADACLDLESLGDEACYVELWVMEESGVWKKLYRFTDVLYGISCRDEFKLYDIYEDSFLNLAPYGPKQWTKCSQWHDFYNGYDRILSGHVYEKSMFLMDDAEAESYTNNEMVCVSY